MNGFPLGFITPSERTADQHNAHAAAVAKMHPRFSIDGAAPDPGPIVMLTDFWRHKDVVAALGRPFSGFHQLTGSCVGVGGGNAVFSLAAIEVIRNADPEQIVQPFWPYTYGISRMLLGETSEGEGSLGSTFAEAAKTYGIINQAEPGLPVPQDSDGLTLPEREELHWSNGKAIPSSWVQKGKTHLVRSTAPIRNADELRAAVRNFYPVTFASNNFIEPGTERQSGEYYVGKLNHQGGHQTSVQGVVDTPGGNYLFLNVNQWGLRVYKGLGNAVWMEPSEVDRALRSLDAEIFAFSQFDGFPAQYVMVSEGDILPRA
jgi:hypothetical protein